MADEKTLDRSKDGGESLTSMNRVMKAPPKMAPPNANSDAKSGASVDPTKKKKALPPPANPPPKSSASAAAAFRSKASLPPPNGPPPGASAPSASVAKIRGAVRPPSSGPPGAQAKVMSPPSSAPPSMTPSIKSQTPQSTALPKADAKSVSTPRTPTNDSIGDSKPVHTGPSQPKLETQRSSLATARNPERVPSRAAPVDVLGDESHATVAPSTEKNATSVEKSFKAAPQVLHSPPTATVKAPPVMKPPSAMKGIIEMLNNTTTELSARGREAEDEAEAFQRSSVSTDKAASVFSTKMGMAAQFSGPSRLNVPEEVITVKKHETKATDVELSARAKPGNSTMSRAISSLDDSFDDVEEIPFLEDTKPDAKGKNDEEEKSVVDEDDPEIVLESKRGSSNGRAPSSQSEVRNAPKNANVEEEKEDTESVARRTASREDVYDDLRRMRRRSPRDKERIDSEEDTSRSSSFDKKDKLSSYSDESFNDQRNRGDREDFEGDRDREKPRGRRKEKRRSKQAEVKQIRAQFFNPKNVPYVSDHLLEFVKRPLECGRGQIVKCFIERNDSGPNKLAPIYTLLVEVNNSSGRPIMYARKKATSRITSHYVISMNREDLFLSRVMRSHQYIGKLRSTTNMMEYSLYDHGDNPEDLDSDCEVDDELRRSIRAELAVIRYHNAKKPYPRKMEVVIPSVLENGKGYLEWRPLSRDQMMEEHVRTIIAAGGQNVLDANNFVFLHKRETKYDALSSCIVDFRSRATCVSVKNFQLVHSEPTNDEMCEQYRKSYPEYVYDDQGTVSLPQELVLLQVGKVGKDCFNMDYQYPLSMLQAFAISLSRFDTKQR